VVDGQPLVRLGVREVLDDGFVVHEAASCQEAVDLVRDIGDFDVAIVDMRWQHNGSDPVLSGAEAIRILRRSSTGLGIVAHGERPERHLASAALQAGASAYVLKSAHTVDIAAVLRQASSGAVFHAPATAPARNGAAQGPALPVLTDRERSILSAVASGMTTSAISRDLWISEHTIKFHLTNIYRKLGVVNRAGAVRYAMENGIA